MRPEIAADAGGEMRELHFQRRQLVEQAAELIMRTAATISENCQPSMRPRSSAYICSQRMTFGSGWMNT